jgi:PEP-CTERM motif
MRKFAFAAIAALMASGSANATVIIGLCNTGQNGECTGVQGGPGNDTNWTLVGGPTQNAFRMRNVNGSWIADNSTSRWIGPTNNGADSFNPTSDGLFAYGLTFQIGSGFNPATASFLGRFAVDNRIDSITLNGTTLAANGGSFGSWTSFGANSGFVRGANVLTFNVRNTAQATGNPTGLRVEFTESAIAAVPEPATWAMMILGFGVVGGAMRRRKAATMLRVAYA